MRRRVIGGLPLAFALALADSANAQTARQNPAQFIQVRSGETCDRNLNFKVFLGNKHWSRDINATVRWRVYNGRFTTNTYRLSAGAEQQIGCAADAKIVAASFITPASRGEPEPRTFIKLRTGNACDQFHTRQVFLANGNRSRDINVTVQWRVIGGPFTTNTFRIDARTERQVGCAADVKVTGASYLTR